MSAIYVGGCGAVSPAGWGVEALRQAIASESVVASRELKQPGNPFQLSIRQVPPSREKPSFLAHPRFRRASPIAQFAIASALEAVGSDLDAIRSGDIRLGVLFSAMSGCVNYSRRFYEETLRDPSTASPLVFPETVFNAPASHIAAFFNSTAISYTMVGDPGTFLQCVVIAADWLTENRVDACLVIGAEESDWLTGSAYQLFVRRMILSDGAGALYLKRAARGEPAVALKAVTQPEIFSPSKPPSLAMQRVRTALPASEPALFLCDGRQGIPALDEPEEKAWSDWSSLRVSPKRFLGEALAASAAWQCIETIHRLRETPHRGGIVSVAGCNQQAIGALFEKTSP